MLASSARSLWNESHLDLATVPSNPGEESRLTSSVNPAATASVDKEVTPSPAGLVAKIAAEEEEGAMPAFAVRIRLSWLSQDCSWVGEILPSGKK